MSVGGGQRAKKDINMKVDPENSLRINTIFLLSPGVGFEVVARLHSDAQGSDDEVPNWSSARLLHHFPLLVPEIVDVQAQFIVHHFAQGILPGLQRL